MVVCSLVLMCMVMTPVVVGFAQDEALQRLVQICRWWGQGLDRVCGQWFLSSQISPANVSISYAVLDVEGVERVR